MEWDEDTCINFIMEYKKKIVLWNTGDYGYYDKTQKEDAWKELSEKLGKSTEKLKKKMESLKGSYRREKTRVKRRMAMAKGRYKVYKSKWFAYEILQFLDQKKSPRAAPDDLQSESDYEEPSTDPLDISFEKERMLEGGQNNEELSDQQASAVIGPRNRLQDKELKSQKKHQMKIEKDDEDSRISDAIGYLPQTTSTSNQQNDQCGLFGDYIAHKLRTFDDRLRAIAQHRINNILFELEMNLYQNSHGHTKVQSSNSDRRNGYQRASRILAYD